MTTKPLEFARFLNSNGALVSLRDDGTTWAKTIDNPKWRLAARKKADLTLEAWKAKKLAKVAELPWWATEVKSLPSVRTIEGWVTDSVCETVTGFEPIEPDGRGPGGDPSWLLALGLV